MRGWQKYCNFESDYHSDDNLVVLTGREENKNYNLTRPVNIWRAQSSLIENGEERARGEGEVTNTYFAIKEEDFVQK